MKRTLVKSILFFAAIFLINCSKNTTDPPPPPNTPDPPTPVDVTVYGTENTLEIATWNIEHFPKHGYTIRNVAEIIRDLDVDIFAIQEIESASNFQQLLDSLPEYDGRVGTGAADEGLWPGILYKNSIVSLLSDTYLFTNDSYNFPRAPYSLYLRAQKNGKSFDFTAIILHLKAFDDSDSISRRRNAIQKLEGYIETQLQITANDSDYVVIGDWNDLLDDPTSNNVFTPFLDEPGQYTFLTAPFAGSSTEYSYIGGNFKSLIDHIMITSAVGDEYQSGSVKILKIDQEFAPYEEEVSDHRPVAAKFAVF